MEIVKRGIERIVNPKKQTDADPAEVWANPEMDKLRRKECLCVNCGRKNDTPRPYASCPTAAALYTVCLEHHMAVAITRCGAVYAIEPSFGYNDKIRNMPADEKSRIIEQLEKLKDEMVAKRKIKPDMIAVDNVKLRLLASRGIVQRMKKDLKAKGLYPAVVEDLPTYDEFEIESEEI